MRPGAEYGSFARALNSSRQYYLEGFQAGARREPDGAPPAPPARLSWEEQTKRDLFPFDAFPCLSACALADEPPSDADRFRFQWFGLFYQGPQKDAFTARLRLPGGRLQGFQWLELARIVQELAGGYVECNAQGGLDLPGIPVRASVELLRRVEGIGLSARGTGGDCVRAVRGGVWEDLPLIHDLEHALVHGREFGDLPGPCEVAFRAAHAGAGAESIVFEGMATARAEQWPSTGEPDPEPWRLILPGSGELGIAVASAETVPACLALLRLWSRQADRETREHASLTSFCRGLGTTGLREALEKKLGRPLALSLPPDARAGSQATVPVGIEVMDGRLLSGQMESIARLLAEHENAEVSVVVPGSLFVRGGANAAAFEAQLRRIVSAEAPP